MNKVLRTLACLMAVAAAQPALAVPTCTVASGASLSFGTVVPLASTGDIASNSGSSFWVNCTIDVSSTPAIYSISTRTMTNGGSVLPFHLSAISPGGLSLPTSPPGSPLALDKNGSNETVTLYGKILAADFKGLPSGVYSQVVWVTVEY